MLRALVRTVGHALRGLASAWKSERNLRLHAAAGAAWLAALVWLRPALLYWTLNVFALALVLAAELLNTALEKALDRLHPERHEAIGMAKDCAAGGVLLTWLGAVSVAVFTLVSVA